jgi:hypothetical protein
MEMRRQTRWRESVGRQRNEERAQGMTTLEWWRAAAFRVNRWYALGVLLATVVAFGMPALLSLFVPCAEFMEIEWLMVAAICVTGIGLLNIAFSFLPPLEAVLPRWSISPFRTFVLVGVPMLILAWAMWLAFSPFWYALLNDPELLCD